MIFGIGGEIWNDGLSKNDAAFILAFRSFVLVGNGQMNGDFMNKKISSQCEK